MSLELRVPPPVVALVCGLVMWAMARLFPGLQAEVPGAYWLAGGCAFLGLAVAGAGIIAFHRAGTTHNPMKPDKASVLVTSGIYRWTRNPMYLAWLPIALGWAIFLAHPITLAVVPLFLLYITRYQIVPEERVLREKFGAPFEAYCARVPRWL
jgi:protein-S-isoprenylcysteine O-methyltransferase Ste14